MARLLLADNNPSSSLALVDILEASGNELVHVHSGEEALRCAKDQDFAVILLDSQLHGPNAAEIAGFLKQHERSRSTPIVFLGSADADVLGMVSDCAVSSIYKRAQQLQAQLAAIVISSDDAIIGKDLNGTITSWNRGAELLYGYTEQEILGQPISLLIPPGWPNDVITILERIKRGEQVEHYETKRMAKDGTILDVSLTVSPIRDEEGRIIGASKIARNITERRQHEIELAHLLDVEQQAHALAEQAVKSRDEFLAVASHELKTPITSLRGFVQIIIRKLNRTGTLDLERLRDALTRVDKQSIKLTNLLDHLLDSSRIMSGHLALDQKPTHLSDLIKECIEQAQAETSIHQITFEAAQDMEASIDALRFEQVITNLLSNAIRYSPAGGRINVELSCHDADWIQIAVTDQGIGVAAERREHLFERFYQAHQAGFGGGMGLGLYISKEIIELHGGHLRAKFPEAGGSRFIVTVPINL